MLAALIFLPLAAGMASFFILGDALRRGLLVGTAFVECLLAASFWVRTPDPLWDVFGLDAPGLLVLSVTALLFLAASVYAVGYLSREDKSLRRDFTQKFHFTNAPEAVFTACLLLFLFAATVVACSRHLGLLWVGIEATTLASAPLIYFHRHRRSLEATWKYLIICSVGIALALLGNFLLDISWQQASDQAVPMTLPALLQNAGAVNERWFKAAFIFIFIGYGTKMGLAPMHTWLPDAHSEAPSLVSALLSGALLNCAFLGIARAHQLSLAAGFGAFSQELFVLFGLVSMGLAAMFIVGQSDYKRMLAYSSVEHMGVILLGVGAGGLAVFGSMLHLVCHSLTKAALFLLAGNILAAYRSQCSLEISGLHRVLPQSGPLWVAGFFAIAGSPPFGIFASEFTVLRGLTADGFGLTAFFYLLFLGVIFVGMANAVLRMAQGEAPARVEPVTEKADSTLPPACLLLAALMLGLYQPAWLRETLQAAAQVFAQ